MIPCSMTLRKLVTPLLALGALAACADPDRVLFVTTTQIGIDADAKKESVSIGFDRYEGYVGPVYDNGAAPPVLARIQSDLAPVSPRIKQLYATGEAAIAVAKDDGSSPTAKPLSGGRRLMLFGTGTNLGLKASFAGAAPAEINLGYKRGEFSLIPIGKDRVPTAKQEDAGAKKPVLAVDLKSGATIDKPGSGTADTTPPTTGTQEVDVYASVLAAVDIDTSVTSPTGSKLGASQFFATGAAAEALAVHASIKELFRDESQKGLGVNKIACDPIAAGDTSKDRLNTWVMADKAANLPKLEKSKEDMKLDVSNTTFLTCGQYKTQREMVIAYHQVP